MGNSFSVSTCPKIRAVSLTASAQVGSELPDNKRSMVFVKDSEPRLWRASFS